MFSKNMMIYTAISIFFSLTYKRIYQLILSVPESMYRPLGISIAIGLFVLIRMYLRGDLREEAMIEKIVDKNANEFAPKK